MTARVQRLDALGRIRALPPPERRHASSPRSPHDSPLRARSAMRANTPSGTAEPPDRHPDQPDTLPTLNDQSADPEDALEPYPPSRSVDPG
jgi:hypothetical protein